jgi:hypothetical protein
MLQPYKKTGRRATLVLALIFLVLSLVYFIHELYKIQSKVSEVREKSETTKFFKLLLEKDITSESASSTSNPAIRDSDRKEHEPEPIIVQSIKILPQHPSINDSIKAQATTNYADEKISYEYKWYINDKEVENIKGDTLPKGMFKKNDQISVAVAPFMDGKQGRSFISAPILIQNSPPSLEIVEMPKNVKLGDVMEFQLIGSDPDGDKLTYALEPPVIEGMTINKDTGKIIWKPHKREKGIHKFSASASDPDGGKYIRTFELEIK